MNILLPVFRLMQTRLPLFAGMILLQVTPPAVSMPTNISDVLFQALSNVPIYVILAYIVINIQHTTAKENERRDKHEDKITDLLSTQTKRVDVIEEDRKVVEKERNETTRMLSKNTADFGEIVKALSVRTEFLIDSDKASGDTLNKVSEIAKLTYDRIAIAFPGDANIEELLGEIKGALEEIKKACLETKKTKTGELPIVLPPAPTDPAKILYTGVLPDDLPKTGTDG